MTAEVWKIVRDFPDYEVSSLGRVRSWKKTGRGKGRRKEPKIRKLVPASKRGGYLTVTLSHEGELTLRYVHHLVLESFGKRKRRVKEEARHLDRDVTNNVIRNLRWGVHKKNYLDQLRHGTDTRGYRNGGSKLSESQAREIKRRLSLGERGCHLAKQFNLSQATVCRIKHGKRYAIVRF